MTDSNQTTRSVKHATFTIERTYAAAPARVFAALSTKEAKGKWFGGPAEWTRGKWELDFRVGGREVSAAGPPGGPEHIFVAQYLDIVENARIIYAYDMFEGEKKLSVSLATFELAPAGKETRLTLTEHGAFLDGHEDPAQREHGTRWLLEKLGETL
ncbi:MAG TPA: SRPBCC family protein [Polyangia bacterium]|nr:SRPBCC family protein [Polyangia bacterium]